MRKLSTLILAMTLTGTACAMLPTPTDEVSFTATPNANPNAPTTLRTTQTHITQTPIHQTTPTQSVPVQAVAVAPLQQAISPATLSQGNISSVVNAFIVQNVNGAETLVPINVGTPIKSGDILEYQGLFTNHGERVRSMDVTLTIDDKLELVGGLSPSFAHASVDNSRFVRMPIRANIDGQVQELPLSYYKALRWTVEDVGMGGTAVVKYRAIVK